MSNTLKARLKVAAITVVATISISGALVMLPQLAKAATIDELLKQIADLQKQISSLQGSSSSTSGGTGLNLTVNLQRGSSGSQVTALQTALKTDVSVYPEGIVSGFFGALTEKAVQRFQAKYGIVSSGTPATTGYGRVGPKTRAKLNEVFGGGVVVTPPGTTTPPPPSTTVPSGSGLTVSSVDQPAATLAPSNAARLPFTKIKLTASADGDVTVKSLTVTRAGLGDDAVFSGIILLDDAGTQIGLSKTFNANHQLSLNQAFTVKAGTSKTLTIAANMASGLSTYAGQVINLQVAAVDAGSAAVSGSLPISGNGMTINGSLTIGSATMTRGSTDPGAANTENVGTVGYTFSSVKLTAGSGEDLLVKSVRFLQAGSVAAGDLANVKVVAGGTAYDTQNDGKYWWATFGDGITVAKGANLEMAIKGDIVSGSNRTVDFDLDRYTDIVAVGKLYGYNITPSGGSSGSASAGAFSSDQQPAYNAYAATVSKGTLVISKSNAVTATNIPTDISNTPLGSFQAQAQGEDIQITNAVLNMTFTGTGSSSAITSVSIVDSNGNAVAGPKDPASGIVTLTDTWTIPATAAGNPKIYTVKGKVSSTAGTSFVNNDTITFALTPSSLTAKGVTTGLSISPTPSAQVSLNTQTVKAAALAVTVSPTPVAQNVVRGLTGFTFAKIQYDASASGEDLRITAQGIRDTLDVAASGSQVNTCQMFDGTTALNDGSNVVNPTAPSGTTNDLTFTLNNALIVTKGTIKVIDVKCNILASATSNSTHSMGILSGTNGTTVTGVTTGNTVTATVTTGTGQTMTIKTGGSFTVAKDSSSPSSRWVIAGKTDQTLLGLRFRATDEALALQKIQLSFASSTASTTDFVKATLWDGATKVGEAVFGGTNTAATTTLTGNFVIPANGEKVLTVKADLSPVDTTPGGTTGLGRRLGLNFSAAATTSTTAIGQSSGSSFNSSTSADINGDAVSIVKTYPTLQKLSVPQTTLVNSTMDLYRWSITAPTDGDVSLYRFTFTISSTTAATTSAFTVYAFSDSGFSNPASGSGNGGALNSAAAANVGSSTIPNSAGVALAASSTRLAIYFDPVSKTDNNLSGNAEAFKIPAGTTVYFTLKGTVAQSATGDSFTVQLLGDSGFQVRTSNRFLETAQAVDQRTLSNFIWAPNSTTTPSPTTTVDWNNGYLLPGLPSTGMDAQIFSK